MPLNKETKQNQNKPNMAYSAGDAEYTDCISAEGYDSPNECTVNDIKQFDCEAPVMMELWSTPLLPLLPGQL